MKEKELEIIKKLLEIMREENLTEIEIKKPFFKIKLSKEKIGFKEIKEVKKKRNKRGNKRSERN